MTHITIDARDGTEPVVLDEFSARGTRDSHDPAYLERPDWRLRYRPKRNAHRVEFMPLDTAGAAIEADTVDAGMDPN